MKKFLIALMILTGCGDAEQITVKNVFSPQGGNFNLLTNQEVDPELRDASILIYPNDRDFAGYSNKISDYYYQNLFKGTFKRIPQKIERQDSNYNKKRKFVMEVMGIGAVRDQHFLRIEENEIKSDQLKEELHDDYFSKFPCYQFKSGEHKRDCSLEETPETKAKPKYQKSCSRFKSYLRKYPLISEEDKAAYEQAIIDCEEHDNGQSDRWSDESKESDDIREMGKDAVIKLFETIETNANEKFYVSVEPSNSRIKLTQSAPGVYVIEEFSLYLDNGNGSKAYSVANGAVKIKSFRQLPNGQKYIDLKMDLEEFVIETDIWFATHNHFDVRLISNKFKATYPDGTVRSGVMRVDMDFVE